MLDNKLSCSDTVWHFEVIDLHLIQNLERIYLIEWLESLPVSLRDRGSKGRPQQPPKEVEAEFTSSGTETLCKKQWSIWLSLHYPRLNNRRFYLKPQDGATTHKSALIGACCVRTKKYRSYKENVDKLHRICWTEISILKNKIRRGSPMW